MEDIREYLESKDLVIRERGSEHISTHCMFHDETPDKPGRLYINVDEAGDKYGVFFCHRCNAKGNYNTIRHYYGDDPIKLDPVVFKKSPIFEVAAKYYEEKLLENPEAYKYLTEERGIYDETIRNARLGWADGGLCTHLIQQGFDAEDIKSTGLVNRFGEDFFKNQITFPYLEYGIAISIRGKGIGKKTISLPGELPLPYGVDSIIGEKTVSICEGEIDTLTLQQFGFPTIGIPGALTFKSGWEDYLDEAKRVYTVLDQDKAGKAGAEKIAGIIGPKVRVVELPKKGIDVNDWYLKYGKNADDFEYLMRKAKGGLLISIEEAMERWTEIEGNPDVDGLRFGIDEIDSVMDFGLIPGQIMTMIARTGNGKHHPLDTDVMTPIGLRKWGDLEVGDEVFGSDGQPTKVTAIYDRGVLPNYRVTFSDNSSVLAGADHIWSVHKSTWNRDPDRFENRTTEQLISEGLIYVDPSGRNRRNFTIPMTQPLVFGDKDFLIEPYTLGSILANGHLSGASTVLTTPDEKVAHRIIDEGTELSVHKKFDCQKYGLLNLRDKTRTLGIDVKSAEKFIPEEYFFGSIEQRLALLQGLCDGDGSYRRRLGRSFYYDTTSPQLAKDVSRLLNTLGGTGIIRETPRIGDNEKEYLDIRVSCLLPEGLNAFSTDRKNVDTGFKNKFTPRRAIVSIEPEGESEVRCITVAAADSLYLIGKECIVTHNTIWSLNLLHRMRLINPEIKILFLSLEQTRNEWFERAHRIHNFYEPGATVIDTVNFWKNNLYLVDKNRVTEDQLIDSIDQYQYEMGILPDFVVIDYLGYYARSFSGNNIEKVSDAIMGAKAIAKDFGLAMFLPHQANRTNTLGTRLSIDQAKDAATVEETSDIMLTLWRPDQHEEAGDEANGQVRQEIVKTRQGGFGTLIKYIYAPLTYAIIPSSDPLYSRVLQERQFALAGDDWKTAVNRHLTGNMDI